MISDKERRRAVAELREASTGAYRHVDSLDVIANSVGVEVAGKFSHEVENETYAALADLIDVPTCVMTNVGGDFENSFQCSNCKNEFDMPDYDRYPYKRCLECGAVVVDED